ncbi:MAG: hypothetical protein ACFBWO_10155, partial [Paracoccaceae bacterium]
MMIVEQYAIDPVHPRRPRVRRGYIPGRSDALRATAIAAGVGLAFALVATASQAATYEPFAGSVSGGEGNSRAVGVGESPFYVVTGGQRLQYYLDPSLFDGPLDIAGLAFRLDTNAASLSGRSVPEITISMGHGPSARSRMAPAFADNYADGPVELFRDTPVLDAGGDGGVPRAYDIAFAFDRDFAYDPTEGALLVEIATYANVSGIELDLEHQHTTGALTGKLAIFAAASPTGATWQMNHYDKMPMMQFRLAEEDEAAWCRCPRACRSRSRASARTP